MDDGEDIRARWGLPDWTKPEDYPAKATDPLWRWEFLRRRPDYREAWDQWEAFFQRDDGGVVYAITDEPVRMELKFGVSVIYDPRQQLDEWTAWQLFRDAHGCLKPVRSSAQDLRRGADIARREAEEGYNLLDIEIAWQQDMEEACKEAGLMDYSFNIRKPLKPQIEKAFEHLLVLQEELHRKENTPKPSRELWPTYLRILDAHDCGVGWGTIGKTLWPTNEGSTKDKARRTHSLAEGVRDKFPV